MPVLVLVCSMFNLAKSIASVLFTLMMVARNAVSASPQATLNQPPESVIVVARFHNIKPYRDIIFQQT